MIRFLLVPMIVLSTAGFGGKKPKPAPTPAPIPSPMVSASPRPIPSASPSAEPSYSPSPKPSSTALPLPPVISGPGGIPVPSPSPAGLPAGTTCEIPKAKNPKTYIGDAELADYVAYFLTVGKVAGMTFDISHLTVQLSPPGGIPGWPKEANVVGACTSLKSGQFDAGIVTINRDWFVSQCAKGGYLDGETMRKLVFLHELGHCLLYRGHLGGSKTNGAPISIMFGSMMLATQYDKDAPYYNNELFFPAPLVVPSAKNLMGVLNFGPVAVPEKDPVGTTYVDTLEDLQPQ